MKHYAFGLIQTTMNIQPDDYVAIELYDGNPHSVSDYAWLSYRRMEDLDSNRLLEVLEKIQQSGKELDLAHGFEILFFVIRNARGGGGGRRSNATKTCGAASVEEWVKKKRCFVNVQDFNGDCLPRALAVAISYRQWKNGSIPHREWDKIRKKRRAQDEATRKLMEAVGMTQEDMPCDMEKVNHL